MGMAVFQYHFIYKTLKLEFHVIICAMNIMLLIFLITWKWKKNSS